MTARNSGGFTLISAIFLTIVLAVLAVSLVTISSVQHTTSAQQLQVLRADYAARAGVEWALAQGLTCPAGPTSFAVGTFTVTVSCSSSSHAVGAGTETYEVVDVMAQSGTYGTVDFVRRRLQTKVSS